MDEVILKGWGVEWTKANDVFGMSDVFKGKPWGRKDYLYISLPEAIAHGFTYDITPDSAKNKTT